MESFGDLSAAKKPIATDFFFAHGRLASFMALSLCREAVD
jgi:hypothetical protein